MFSGPSLLAAGGEACPCSLWPQQAPAELPPTGEWFSETFAVSALMVGGRKISPGEQSN